MGPTPTTDYLTPSATVFMPLPHLLDPMDGVSGLDDVQRGLIAANHDTNLKALEGYHGKVAEAVSTFYMNVGGSSVKMDNLIQF